VLRIRSVTRIAAASALVAATLNAQAKPAASTTGDWPATVKPVWPDEGPYKWAPRPTTAERVGQLR
jgi:hypothetical protein